MGSNAQRRREARERVEAMRRQEAASARRRTTLFTVGLVLLVLLVIAGIVWAVQSRDGADDTAPDAIRGLKAYDNTGGPHVEGTVDYPQNPPAGGEHNQLVQNCGIYDQPVANENAVHSLEHGAVWITYDPELPASDIETLTAGLDDSYLLVSPYPGLQAPVVASAWNNQVELNGVDDPRLQEFVSQFKESPQAPEPGAPCSGGVSTTTGS